MIIETHFHKKGFALGLVLKQRLAASRKWPITNYNPITHCALPTRLETSGTRARKIVIYANLE